MFTFGRDMLAHWPLDPAITYLNHGTVGVTPHTVLAAQQAIRDEIERQPSRFILRELTDIVVGQRREQTPRLREAAGIVADFLGARADDLVFVDNTTSAANAVLRSFPLQAGDEILASDFGYGGVTQAARFAAREKGATVRVVTLPYPLRSSASIVDAFDAAIGPRTRLAIVDHIAANSALLFPLADIAARLRARGVAVLADGAHVPGAIALDIPSLGVDWYMANLHKWLWVPRSSGILWAAPERQRDLHPPVVSWGLDQGFTTEFDAPGTRDPSAHLAAPRAIAFMQSLGVDAVQRYNHRLAWDGAHRLAARWGTEFTTPESMLATMATVMLPEALGQTSDDAARVRDRLLFDDRIEVAVHAYEHRLWVRISAQIYNDMADIDRLADTIAQYTGS
jgi:isopenicillin-N epimerase